MRVSCDPADPGYVDGAYGRGIKVLLDGMPLGRGSGFMPVTADEEAGTVFGYPLQPDGRAKVENGRLVHEERTGRVQVTLERRCSTCEFAEEIPGRSRVLACRNIHSGRFETRLDDICPQWSPATDYAGGDVV